MAFVKQTINDGDTITSTWGNNVQTQYDEVASTLLGNAKFRTSSGYVEYDDGSGWKAVSGGGIMVSSDVVQESTATEYTLGSWPILLYKFAPKFPGEIKITADMAGNGAGGAATLIAVFANSQLSSGSSYLMGQSLAPPAVDWQTPVGTDITGSLTVTGNLGYVGVTFSDASATYASKSGKMTVRDLAPIYFMLQPGSSGSKIKNLTICYDTLRG